MPLLRMDNWGNIGEYGFGSEITGDMLTSFFDNDAAIYDKAVNFRTASPRATIYSLASVLGLLTIDPPDADQVELPNIYASSGQEEIFIIAIDKYLELITPFKTAIQNLMPFPFAETESGNLVYNSFVDMMWTLDNLYAALQNARASTEPMGVKLPRLRNYIIYNVRAIANYGATRQNNPPIYSAEKIGRRSFTQPIEPQQVTIAPAVVVPPVVIPQPAVETVTQPIVQTYTQPVFETVTQPVVETYTQPIVQDVSQPSDVPPTIETIQPVAVVTKAEFDFLQHPLIMFLKEFLRR